MKKNFQIKHTSVEIIDRNQNVYDVHNCYEFVGAKLIYGTESKVELDFRKKEGDWIKESDPNNITFVFQGVKYFELSKLFFIEQSSTIDELGYKDVTDYDYDWLMGEEHFTGEQHFIFRFLYGEHIRIFSESADLIVS